MRILKQELYFPLIIGIHFIIWAVALYFYNGTFMEVKSNTLFFGELTNESWMNIHRILGEVLSSWVVTVFAINFLMATRARWIEKIFGGLDKTYVIHRRAAVIAVVLLIAHFIVVPRDLGAFNIGKPLGFVALVLILIGVVISAAPVFKKKIPYHKWINFHKLMGPFYILAVIHGAMVHSLIKELPLVRTYVFGMAIIGVGAWFYKAFLYQTFNKKLDYIVSSVSNLGNGITEIYLKATGTKLKFRARQFAFFTFPSINKQEQHPFTISSHHLNDEIRVTIKELGDYTNKIAENLKEGAIAKIEGPFGLFSSRYAKEKEQIWIAGGIGITPFLSLSKDFHTHKVKLIWSVINKEEAKYSEELTTIANENPNFEFNIWSSNDSGFLTADQFGINQFKDKVYLICGPETLKKSIIKQLAEKGVKRDDIYDEEFAFR
jgi:predicted ferric reductase